MSGHDTTYSRRRTLALIGAGIAVGVGAGMLAGCSGGGQAATLRVADQLHYLQAIFKASGEAATKAPYAIEWSNFVSGPAIVSAATGGSVDVGWMASTPLVFAQSSGSPLKIVAAFDAVPAADGRAGMGIVVSANSPIKTVADLKGKRLSYALGTITQYIALQTLASAGLTLKDVTPVISTVDRAAPLLEAGQTDALVAVEPMLSRLVQSGKARLLSRAIDHVREVHFVVAPEAALKKPQTVEYMSDFVRRMARGLEWWGTNPDDAAKETVGLYQVKPEVAAVIARHIVRRVVPITPDLIAFQQKQADAFLAAGQIPRKIDVAAMIDPRLEDVLATTAGGQHG